MTMDRQEYPTMVVCESNGGTREAHPAGPLFECAKADEMIHRPLWSQARPSMFCTIACDRSVVSTRTSPTGFK